MAEYLIQGETLTAIANAIRAKRGITDTIIAEDFASEILSISTGGGSNQKFAQLINGTLTELTAEDLAGITGIRDYLFKGTDLESIVIPDSATYIGEEAFYDCSSLTSVVIGNGVTSIGGSAFENCGYLESVVMGNSVQTIDSYAFYYCDSLTSVVMGNSVADIGDEAFYGCSSLKRVDFSRHTFVPSIELNYADEWPFDGCHEDLEIVVPANLLLEWQSATNWSNYASYIVASASQGLAYVDYLSGDAYEVAGIGDCTDLDIVIPRTYNGKFVSSIAEGAFYWSEITGVIIPNSVTNIGSYDEWAYGAFENCHSLESVVMGNLVENIGANTFNGCSSLTNITIPNSVRGIGYSAFYYCSSLTSVVIGDSVRWICNEAFNGCSDLETVVMGNSVEEIGESTEVYAGVFFDCPNLKQVDFSRHTFVPTLLDGNAFDETHADLQIKVFEDIIDQWKSATNWSKYADKIVVGRTSSKGLEYELAEDGWEYDGYDGYVVIGIGDCTDTDIIIPSIYNGQPVTVIGSDAFAFESITSVTIPDSVERIGFGAFQASDLESAVIGKNVDTIDELAFEGCSNLKRVDFSRHTFVPTIYLNWDDEWPFYDCHADLQIKVPASLINQWKSATNWSSYARKIVTEFTN